MGPDSPSLSELRLHNGTVWRWNRPIYDVMERRGAAAGCPTPPGSGYLAVIEQHCVTHRTGASWQRATGRLLAGQGADRPAALGRGVSRGYLEHMHSHLLVHDWPSP